MAYTNELSLCHKRGRQKGIGKNVTKNEKRLPKSDQKREQTYQKVTENNVSGLPPFAYPVLRHVDT